MEDDDTGASREAAYLTFTEQRRLVEDDLRRLPQGFLYLQDALDRWADDGGRQDDPEDAG